MLDTGGVTGVEGVDGVDGVLGVEGVDGVEGEDGVVGVCEGWLEDALLLEPAPDVTPPVDIPECLPLQV